MSLSLPSHSTWPALGLAAEAKDCRLRFSMEKKVDFLTELPRAGAWLGVLRGGEEGGAWPLEVTSVIQESCSWAFSTSGELLHDWKDSLPSPETSSSSSWGSSCRGALASSLDLEERGLWMKEIWAEEVELARLIRNIPCQDG